MPEKNKKKQHRVNPGRRHIYVTEEFAEVANDLMAITGAGNLSTLCRQAVFYHFRNLRNADTAQQDPS